MTQTTASKAGVEVAGAAARKAKSASRATSSTDTAAVVAARPTVLLAGRLLQVQEGAPRSGSGPTRSCSSRMGGWVCLGMLRQLLSMHSSMVATPPAALMVERVGTLACSARQVHTTAAAEHSSPTRLVANSSGSSTSSTQSSSSTPSRSTHTWLLLRQPLQQLPRQNELGALVETGSTQLRGISCTSGRSRGVLH